MIPTGECPHCKNLIANARVEPIKLLEGFTPAWKGASFICPSCSCVLSVGFDQVAMKAAIVDENACTNRPQPTMANVHAKTIGPLAA
jgi:hypothetical protein